MTVGFLAAARPSVREAVDAARDLAPVAVASYLIGRGFFKNRLEGSGGGWVTEPLGAHPALVEIIAERYLVGSGTLTDPGSSYTFQTPRRPHAVRGGSPV